MASKLTLWCLRLRKALTILAVAAILPASRADSRDTGPVDVFILTGQSNSLGTTADRRERDITPPAHDANNRTMFFWSNRSTRSGDGPAALIGSSEGRITKLLAQQGEGANKLFWGPEFGFAHYLHERGQNRTMIIKASRGGGGNSFWLKDSKDDHMYRHVVTTVNAALAAVPRTTRIRIRALIYIQGESDNASEASIAGKRLATLHKNLCRDIPNAKNMRMIILGIATKGARRDLVRKNQSELASSKNITYIDTTDLQNHLYDNLHFDKKAKLIIGRRAGAAWLNWNKNSVTANRINEDFESYPSGALTLLKGNAGQWKADTGTAEILSGKAFKGKKSIRIFGGSRKTLTFEPNWDRSDIGEISFRAERWTRRAPFEFRVEAEVRGKWHEIYRGDKTVRIGHFSTHVKIPIKKQHLRGARRFRFVCLAASGGGVIMDEVKITGSQEMEIESVTTEQPVLPVLLRNNHNPLAVLHIHTIGDKKPLSVRQIIVKTDGSIKPRNISHLEIFRFNSDGKMSFDATNKFGKPRAYEDSVTFKGSIELQPGENRFSISVKLKNGVNIDGWITAGCESITLSDKQLLRPAIAMQDVRQRLGIALRKSGDDGSIGYRIPGLATTKKGTLIGVYDIRYKNFGDLPGDIDVGMSRSTDGGRTWEPMQNIMNMGNNPRFNHDGIGDPAILVDTKTGTIWVAAVWSHGNRAWFGSGPGLSEDETGQFVLVKSEDDGKTWSKPINITEQIKDPNWCYLLQGPGKGITMTDGTIVFPAQYQDTPENKRLPHSTIIYSRDHGKTWNIGTGAYPDTTEAQVVELEPGVLMLNCRYNRQNHRVVMTTTDMGKTWTEHPSSRKALVEPRACMASIIDVNRELGRDEAGLLLFSNPAVTSGGRRRITIKASRDGGMTWPEEHQVLLDEHAGAGYSCLSMIDEKTVGILFESSRAPLAFMRVPLEDILSKKKSNAAK